MQTLQDIAEALETQRRALRITYDDLSAAAGLTPLATRRALKAQTAPRVTTLMALADKLGLEVVIVPKAVATGLQAPAADAYRPLSRVEQLTLARPTPDKG
jgi:transcriptional regulator with XRE-family HTH domain